MNIFFTQKRHNSRADSGAGGQRLHRSDGFPADAGVFCGNKGHCGSIARPQAEPSVGDLARDGRLSTPPCVTQIAEAGEGRAARRLLSAALLPLRPYEPNTRPPFWCLSGQLRCTCGISNPEAIGFVHALHEARSAGRVSRPVSRRR
ncbi:hypothetical protein L3Q82_005538 [Scortum barcoo]|uniref:Uncharacterized protein n=1 Tax=Scortum barcoo TaxID=214431 RepID=A0ACB8VAD7_9TELE|nr:hypothetical protein L3Q82_005538 [Scortum barcoo]